MALAERLVGRRFNRPGHEIVNHRTWVIASDGDMMEGISSEAASLAGALGLGKLICFYDDNHITIEGETRLAFCELVANRFEAYGWHVLRIEDGNDLDEIARITDLAIGEETRPSLVVVRTHIGDLRGGAPGTTSMSIRRLSGNGAVDTHGGATTGAHLLTVRGRSRVLWLLPR
jgi:transketolase